MLFTSAAHMDQVDTCEQATVTLMLLLELQTQLQLR